MSNYLAVATVTETIIRRLSAAMGVRVLARRPADNAAQADEPLAHLHLYRVAPNSGLSNSDLPTLGADGRRAVQRPRAALDLHYLLCFYGNADELVPQRLLGSAIAALHARPVLTRELIRAAVEQSDFLAGSNLAESVELVKLTPETLGLEDLARLWALFPQASQSLALAYQATVVLIEPDETPRAPLPVLERAVTVLPFRRPTVETVELRELVLNEIPTQALVISGQQLRGQGTRVRLDGAGMEEPRPELVSDRRIVLVYAELRQAPRAGIHGVQVVHLALLGGQQRTVAESAVAPFVVFPSIDDREDAAAVLAENIAEDANTGLLSARITVSRIAPRVEAGQRLLLQLNEYNPDAPQERAAYAYSFASVVPFDAEPADTVVMEDVAGVRPGVYLVRLQVDGAESRLLFAQDPREPERPGRARPQRFVGPRVELRAP